MYQNQEANLRDSRIIKRFCQRADKKQEPWDKAQNWNFRIGRKDWATLIKSKYSTQKFINIRHKRKIRSSKQTRHRKDTKLTAILKGFLIVSTLKIIHSYPMTTLLRVYTTKSVRQLMALSRNWYLSIVVKRVAMLKTWKNLICHTIETSDKFRFITELQTDNFLAWVSTTSGEIRLQPSDSSIMTKVFHQKHLLS